MKGAVFLDRDGVINRTPRERYITRWADFHFLPGTLAALRRLNQSGRMVVVVSNQAGVGRGIMPAARLAEITRRMLAGIRRSGGRIRAVYYCTHRPWARCSCRKPKLGLLRRAARRLRIDLARSFLVGDNATDIAMGRAAGLTTLLVLSGAGRRSAVKKPAARPDRVARNLPEAVGWILRREKQA